MGWYVDRIPKTLDWYYEQHPGLRDLVMEECRRAFVAGVVWVEQNPADEGLDSTEVKSIDEAEAARRYPKERA